MNEHTGPTHFDLFHAACDEETCDIIKQNERLREMLHWALSWVHAQARRGVHTRIKYESAVRMTGKPDPQTYRDGMPK